MFAEEIHGTVEYQQITSPYYDFSMDVFDTEATETSLSSLYGVVSPFNTFNDIENVLRTHIVSVCNAPTSYETTDVHFYTDATGSSEIIDKTAAPDSGDFFVKFSSNDSTPDIGGTSPMLEFSFPFIFNFSIAQNDRSFDINFDSENLVGSVDLGSFFDKLEIFTSPDSDESINAT